ncbi:MAG TPA: hypothetical protein DEF35_23405 [Paenibacillus sp.]|uniref:YcaO-like family protein n=1 Tax=Paenibacillus TaxID=44249 RepID=UPI000BA089D8|nr:MULTISPECIES: YcaO-like family protein [Paenibacillus]OZQ66721.1 hypothetical protein CA599_18235 [Paenibacillus taichungensis]HBU84561.1 hypothetical protein [Paenibacillus sp.]
MLKNPINGTPFMVERFQVKQNSFLLDYFQSDIIPYSENGPPASAIDFDKSRSIKAAIGEHIERVSVFNNYSRFKDQLIEGINMSSGEVELFPLYRILLNWNDPILRKLNLYNIYSDTCGMASHSSSQQSINSAFLECIERQSLLFSWFTKSPAKRICLKYLKNMDLEHILKMSNIHVDEIHMYDISLCDEVKVVMTIAFGDQTKGVGISADWNYQSAIKGSLKEIFQYITVKQPIKNSYTQKNEDSVDPLLYSHYFMEKLNKDELRSEFRYLESSDQVGSESLKEDKTNSDEFYNTVKLISSKLEMDFNLCYIPALDGRSNSKVVKVMTNRGFHHMYAAKIDPNEISILKSYQGRLHNIGKMLPFG